MSIRVEGTQLLNSRLKELSKFMTKTERRRITFSAANAIVGPGRQSTPIRSFPDKYNHPYENPRYLNKKIVAKYIPGNLKKAFRRIPQTNLKKTDKSFVGAFMGKQALDVYGKSPAKSDGYYAGMAFGKNSTIKDYVDKVLRPALNKGGAKALVNMEKKAVQVWSKAKTKLNFK